MPKSKKNNAMGNTQQNQVSNTVNDYIDAHDEITPSDVDVIADNIQIDSKNVSDVAVVRIAQNESDEQSQTEITAQNNSASNNGTSGNEPANNTTNTAEDTNQQTTEATSQSITDESQLDEAAAHLDKKSKEFEHKIHAIKEELTQKLGDKKEAISQKIENIQDTVTETVHTQKEKWQDKVDEFKTQVEDAKANIINEKTRIQDEIKQRENDSQFSKIGLLGKFGAYLGVLNPKNATHEKVDLTKAYNKTAMNEYSTLMAKQVFGQKTNNIQGIASKVLGEDKVGNLTEVVYNKLADGALWWAKKSLLAYGYEKGSALTNQQKDELATNICHENRALAVIGSGVGFFGLKGVVLDTAWLLIIALKTVYQLAAIYEKEITGTQGVNMVYSVVSGANLSKLQEKQILLTALALGANVFENAEKNGLKEEFVKFSKDESIADDYIKKFDDFLKLVHLDKINVDTVKWSRFKNVFSLVSVGVGAYYNQQLIDEVIGTALATFQKEGDVAQIEHQTNHE